MADEELRILLNEGVSNQFGKKKTKAKEEAQAMGLTEAIIDLDILSDSDDEMDVNENAPLEDTNQQQNHFADFVEEEAIEVFKEKTLEDIIEEQRAKLAAQGKVGTPVTAETFAIWRAGKLAKRQAEAEARMKELSKKKGGAKALCKFCLFVSQSVLLPLQLLSLVKNSLITTLHSSLMTMVLSTKRKTLITKMNNEHKLNAKKL